MIHTIFNRMSGTVYMTETTSRARFERLVGFLPRIGSILFVLAIAALVASFYVARGLKFDQNIEALYAEGRPTTQPLSQVKRIVRR